MIDRSTVKVRVTDIDTFKTGFVIKWEGNIGFGEYTIYKNQGVWKADSECMDTDDDHWFLDLLLRNMADRLIEEFR